MNHHSTGTNSISVLIVASDPSDRARLQLSDELRTIEQVLDATKFRDNINKVYLFRLLNQKI